MIQRSSNAHQAYKAFAANKPAIHHHTPSLDTAASTAIISMALAIRNDWIGMGYGYFQKCQTTKGAAKTKVAITTQGLSNAYNPTISSKNAIHNISVKGSIGLLWAI